MKKILKGIAVLAAVLALAIVGLYILTMQPSAPTPELPAPQDREEAWRQDIAFLRDEFLKVDRSFTEETSQEFLDILNRIHDQVPSLSDNRIIVEITRAVTKSANAHTRAYLMRNGNYFRRFPITLILHIKIVKPRYSLILVAKPAVQKISCATRWVNHDDYQNRFSSGFGHI